MTIAAALGVQLAAYTALTDLVSSRIYSVTLPQNATFPALDFFMVGARRESAMGDDPGLVEGLWQVDVWDDSATDCRAVATQVRNALQRYRGTPSGSSTEILDVFVENEHEDHEAEPPLHRVILEFRVWWRE